jgi:hypothetical protein
MVKESLVIMRVPSKTFQDLKEMIRVTGEVKATELLFNKIMEGIVVEDRETLRIMAKDLISKPLFEAFIKWLSNTDAQDFVKNRVYIYNNAMYCMNLFKDIYGIKEKHGKFRKTRVPILRNRPKSMD